MRKFFQGKQILIYHVIDCHSSKQSRTSFSSIGPEILDAATSSDRFGLMVQGLQAVTNSPTPLPLIFTVDSLGCHATISTVHDGNDYRLRPTVTRLRDSFEAGEISVLQWVPGKHNIADELRKKNAMMYRTLNSIYTLYRSHASYVFYVF